MKSDSRQSAFALVIALSLMAFILVLLLTITSLVQVETQSAENSKHRLEAEQAALLSLNVAIGELQKYAGHDQRVTAPADVLFQDTGSAPGPSAGLSRARWAGVWNTADYDPSAPQVKEFQHWLVSTENSATPTVDTADVAEVENNATINDVLIFQGIDDASSVRVPKVQIDGDSAQPTSYAYWVEDEGVKANLAWDQGEYTDDERLQAGRLAASPGADFGVFEGPFTGMSYPIEFGGANTWLENVDKVIATTGLPSLTSTAIDSLSWLREYRHDMTSGTLGLLTDVKNGGLRTDLSIAFEMDGEKDFDMNSSESNFVDPPSRFIQQYGVFAGKNLQEDVFTSISSAGSAKAIARYVYADTNKAGVRFSGDLASDVDRFGNDLTIRGPTWFALREYANMYKRLRGSNGDYELSSTGYVPQSRDMVQNHSVALKKNYGFVSLTALESFEGHYDRYYIDANNGHIIERPFQNNYMPVLLGIASTLSVTSYGSGADENLAVSIDPIFFLWNPYNHRLTADRYGIGFRQASPGSIAIWYDGSASARIQDVDDMLARSAGITNNIGNANRFSLAMTDIELDPGEVKIYYPTSNVSRLSDSSRHPFNTEAFEKDDDVISTDSGLVMTALPRPGGGIGTVKLSEFTDIRIAYGLRGDLVGGRIHTFLGDASDSVASYFKEDNWGAGGYGFHSNFSHFTSGSGASIFEPSGAGINSMSAADAVGFSKVSIGSGVTGTATKQFFGAFSILHSPAGSSLNPTEIFTQFNPVAMNSYGNYEEERVGAWNQEGRFITRNFADHSLALEAAGIILPFLPDSLSNGYWGSNYGGSSGFGSTHVPMLDIPSSPLVSLAQFSHANLGMRSNAALHAVGNSFASVLVDPVSPYGELQESLNYNPGPINVEDVSWLLNDALFDSYYLSGIAADFNISSSGYSANGNTIKDTLDKFYGESGLGFRTAQANPLLLPYVPNGKTPAEIVSELDPETGELNPQSDAACYQRVGAYALIDGAFNVNSTSVAAWVALLRANRGLDVDLAQGGTDTGVAETPFPRGTLPVENAQSQNHWSGLSRLSNDQINDLAEAIVEQVKLRGPFMSLSDFVNHRVGLPKNDATHYMGALQAAIEESGINSAVQSGAGGTTFNYSSSAFADSMPSDKFPGTRHTTTGIYADITQADLLMPLAPRLAARSDTFRIRAYGEVKSVDGSEVVAQSVCEAVLQRLPEYVDTVTDPSNNEAWDAGDATINAINQQFGRRFKVVQFRWLNQSEI